MSRVDLLYLAFNRLEFTRESFPTLLAHTDWSLVRELVVWDDGSTDGTAAWLDEARRAAPVPTVFRQTRLQSPVAVLNAFAAAAKAPVLAKVDNDTMMPAGWLGAALAVFDARPELSLLGLEALRPVKSACATRGYSSARAVSGLGLYRRELFSDGGAPVKGQWFGFEEWQRARGLRAGWLDPALPVFLLDRLPFAPWSELVDAYVARGWQRRWPAYERSATLWHWRFPPERPPGFRLNLGCFDEVLPGFRNVDHLPGPGVDEVVDLRGRWPWGDDSVDEVRAWDVLEHLPDQRHTMNELWRVLRRGARAAVRVPTTDGPAAFDDPTHVSFWNRRSFLYFEAGNPYRERVAAPYRIEASFRVVSEQLDPTPDGPFLTLVLEAVKP